MACDCTTIDYCEECLAAMSVARTTKEKHDAIHSTGGHLSDCTTDVPYQPGVDTSTGTRTALYLMLVDIDEDSANEAAV